MSERPVSDETRKALTSAMTTTLELARESHLSMQEAAGRLIDALVPILQSIDANAHERGRQAAFDDSAEQWILTDTQGTERTLTIAYDSMGVCRVSRAAMTGLLVRAGCKLREQEAGG